MGRKHHVLVGEFAPRNRRYRIEHRPFPEELRVGKYLQHRALAVLGEPEDETVILAAQIQRRHLLGAGAEDLLNPPAIRPAGSDNTGGPGLLQPLGEPARTAATAEADVGKALAPSLACCSPLPLHLLHRGVGCPLFPVIIGPACGLRERDGNEFAASVRQPCCERTGVGDFGHDDDVTSHGAPVGAGAPGEHGALERADPRLDQIDVGAPAPPVHPRAVLLILGPHSPTTVRIHQPLVAGLHSGRSGEPGTDGV